MINTGIIISSDLRPPTGRRQWHFGVWDHALYSFISFADPLPQTVSAFSFSLKNIK